MDTENGRFTSIFLLYRQLSQDRMADFSAFIASKSFDQCTKPSYTSNEMTYVICGTFPCIKKTYVLWFWKCVSLRTKLMIYRAVLKSSHGPSSFVVIPYRFEVFVFSHRLMQQKTQRLSRNDKRGQKLTSATFSVGLNLFLFSFLKSNLLTLMPLWQMQARARLWRLKIVQRKDDTIFFELRPSLGGASIRND